MKKLLYILISFYIYTGALYTCNICGGGTSDVAVLSLDGRFLFNLGFGHDNYLGNWDAEGIWHNNNYSKSQFKTSFAAAYRLNPHIQFSISMPYVVNFSKVPGLKARGNGIGDISVFTRYEFFHEYQVKKVKGKSRIDDITPYLALTFGVMIPTGTSEETAESEVDVTGKGYYTTSLGISLIKSLVKNKLQLSTDFTWQHNFEKKYFTYFGYSVGSGFKKQAGDKFNYGMTLNYIISSEHAISFSTSGFFQNSYIYNGNNIPQSNERVLNFTAAYTFYPHIQFRITPSVKWTFTNDNFGKNTTGSTTFGLNLTYYIPDYKMKLQ